MISSQTFRFVHEPAAPFRVLKQNLGMSGWVHPETRTTLKNGVNSVSKCFHAQTQLHVAGAVSNFHLPVPNRNVRIASLPVVSDNKPVGLTVVHLNPPQIGEYVAETAESQVVAKFFELQSAAACLVDPHNRVVTNFNRQFAEFVELSPNLRLGPTGVPLSFVEDQLVEKSNDRAGVRSVFSVVSGCPQWSRTINMDDVAVINADVFPIDIESVPAWRLLMTFHIVDRVGAEKSRQNRNRFHKLSVRQKEVVRWVVAGCSNAEIADKMSISVKTVEKHRSLAVSRLGIGSVPELVRLVDNASDHSLDLACQFG